MFINLKPRTFDTYESLTKNHIASEIGDIKLKDLQTMQIQMFYNKKYNSGNGLASATIRKIHNVIHASLEQAVNDSLIIKNPSQNIKLPKLNAQEIKAFSVEESNLFFKFAKKTDYYYAFVLGIDTGIRTGELLCLNWNDIDFESGNVSITKTLSFVKDRDNISGKKYKLIVQDPKTKASIRKVPLTKRSYAMLMEMKNRDCLNSQLMFPSRKGTYINLRNFERSFETIVKKSGLEKFNCHTLRHSFATRCFEKRIDIKVISKWLGHSKIAHTLDIYTHVMPDFESMPIQMLETQDSQDFDSGFENPNK